MNSFHIVVAGSNETAVVCALTAGSTNPDKNAALIVNDEKSEFILKLLNSGSFNNGTNDITVIPGQISTRNENIIRLMNGNEIAFEKLVIATGSDAIKPAIEGVEKNGVYFIRRDPENFLSIKNKALHSENIVILGGDYLGVLLADELLRQGKSVTLVQRTNRLLPSSIDLEISAEAKNIIEQEGGKVIFKSKIKEIIGSDSISDVRLRDGEVLKCDCLIICCGEKPNTILAEKFGLVYDSDRGILVDEFHRTSDKNIFAIGECAARFDFFCGDLTGFMLTPTQIEEAKMIGSNLYSVIYNRGKLNDLLNAKRKFSHSIENIIVSENFHLAKQN